MKKTLLLISLSLLIILSVAASAVAEAPILSASMDEAPLGYSGYLTDAGGSPLSGEVDMRFRLYTGAVSGVVVYDSGIMTGIIVRDGVFDVTLMVESSVLNGQSLWLATQVNGESLVPRQPITAVPYAASLIPGAIVSTDSGIALSAESSVGTGLVGTSSGGVGVAGESAGAGDETSYGGLFTSASAAGVCGLSSAEPSESNAFAPGVYASSQNGPGLTAETVNTDGFPAVLAMVEQGTGVKGQAVSGYGLYGQCATGSAVYGENTSGTLGQGYGGFFSSTTGVGVKGVSLALQGISSEVASGVLGESAHGSGVLGKTADISLEPSTEMVGVQGLGEDIGIRGASLDGKGVIAWSASDIALEASSTQSYGAYLTSEESYGAYVSSTSYRGLYASGGSGYYSGYFDSNSSESPGLFVNGTTRLTGDLEVQGNLSVSGSKGGYLVDLAMNVGDSLLHQGDVVVIVGAAEPIVGDIPLLLVEACSDAGSSAVAGIVDERMVVGVEEGNDEPRLVVASDPESVLVAHGDYVNVVTFGAFGWVNVDASSGAVMPGDLLVSSETPGCAMVSRDPGVGTVLGKALGALMEGLGQVPIIVTLD